MKRSLFNTSCIVSLALLLAFNVKAQMLGGEETTSGAYSANSFSAEGVNNKTPEQKNFQWRAPRPSATQKAPAAAQKSQTIQNQNNSRKVPIEYQTLKVVNGKLEFDDSEAIFLYYTNFKINHMVGGAISCDIRFVLKTALADTLSNISMRLKWPRMETTLSFDGVKPGIQTYYDYRLYGEGCYSMDKLPNVIVNRCRLKGHTQRECASLLKLTKYYEK